MLLLAIYSIGMRMLPWFAFHWQLVEAALHLRLAHIGDNLRRLIDDLQQAVGTLQPFLFHVASAMLQLGKACGIRLQPGLVLTVSGYQLPRLDLREHQGIVAVAAPMAHADEKYY